ncbi:MAG TPA: proline--tRNA ligase [Spirochaetia bacterium]|nr:proline--tRNA ligase [Spirochaetia bacterium]
MLYSRLFARTLRQIPVGVHAESHRLLLQGGFIRPLGRGLFSLLPLGMAVANRVIEIVRSELAAIGGQEIQLPVVNPRQLWKRSGRDAMVDREMFRFADRHKQELVLAPTHEEAAVEVVRSGIESYRDLPLFLFQFQTKLRDEARPRHGLVRAREFVMSDGYSFHRSFSDLNNFFPKVFSAYLRIFSRCGVPVTPAEAGCGFMGGSKSYEFLVESECGDDVVIVCRRCGYTANREVAVGQREAHLGSPDEMTLVETPGAMTMELLSTATGLPVHRLAKAMVYRTTSGLVMGVVRGDYDVSTEKLSALLGKPIVRLADRRDLDEAGLLPGYLSPLGLDSRIPVVVDVAIADTPNLVFGANREGYHYLNVNFGRDFENAQVGDIARVQAGNRCFHCGTKLHERRVLEVGNIFKLGDRYTRALDLHVQDEDRRAIFPFMGSYGIGIGRLIAAIVEANHDRKGILWPHDIAPYRVYLLAIGKSHRLKQIADDVCRDFGSTILYDDRSESISSKFKDADLLGIPFRIVVSARTIDDECVEIMERRTGRVFRVPINRAHDHIDDLENGRV